MKMVILHADITVKIAVFLCFFARCNLNYRAAPCPVLTIFKLVVFNYNILNCARFKPKIAVTFEQYSGAGRIKIIVRDHCFFAGAQQNATGAVIFHPIMAKKFTAFVYIFLKSPILKANFVFNN